MNLNRFINHGVRTYILFTFFVFCVFALAGDGSDYYGRIFPFINSNPLIIHLCGSLVFFVWFISMQILSSKRVRFDGICGHLLLKGVLDIVPFIEGVTVKFNSYFQYFICSWIALIIYFTIINTDFREKDIVNIKKLFALFGVVLSTQIIYTSLKCGVGYFDPTYKVRMVIPYGGSNIIAAILLPIIYMVWQTYKKTVFGKIVLIFLVLGLLLTRSRGALLLLFVLCFYKFYKKRLESRKNKIFILCLIIIMIMACIFLVLAGAVENSFDFNITDTENRTTIDLILNGRLQLWTKELFESIKMNHLMFGLGMHPQESHGAGLHNLILDLVIRCGIIGFINYYVMYLKLYRNGKQVADRVFFLMTAIITLNSMYEICYFTYKCDVLLWIIIGMGMNGYYAQKRELSQPVYSDRRII